MCLVTDQQQPKIAEEDITVYKILQGMNAPCNEFTYIVGKTYKTEIKESKDRWCFDSSDRISLNDNYGEDWDKDESIKCFGQGFHSSLTADRLRRTNMSSMWNGGLYECIIPKGSEYYTNPSDLVVSNQIIIKERLKETVDI